MDSNTVADRVAASGTFSSGALNCACELNKNIGEGGFIIAGGTDAGIVAVWDVRNPS